MPTMRDYYMALFGTEPRKEAKARMPARIGYRMEQAVRYVQEHPGCTMHEVAVVVGPHGSSAYGYETVKRCLNAGLIENKGDANRSSLYVKE